MLHIDLLSIQSVTVDSSFPPLAEFYEKVTALRAKGVKVLVAIGGWNDSLGGKYSRLVNSPAARKKFIDHVIQFIQKYNFDGLDLDWEYPANRGGKPEDKQNFVTLVKVSTWRLVCCVYA